MKLLDNRYGKADVRLVRITPGPGDHRSIIELDVNVLLTGDFLEAHTEGDNRLVVPTDTMKNTVFGLARENEVESPEQFGGVLADHFIGFEQVTAVRVELAQKNWQRLPANGGEHPHAFRRGGNEERTAVAERGADGLRLAGGLRGLHVLKATASGFSDFHHDRFTTLQDADDRIFATVVTADWDWTRPCDFNAGYTAIEGALITAFADHYSRSVQETLFRMGSAALEACPDLDAIALTLPNKHNLLVDLSPFELDNPNLVFVATSDPAGLISATVGR